MLPVESQGVSEELIRDQVDRLLRSKTFESSEAHRRLLQYLADKTIAGEAYRLKEYSVGLEAFGKPASYDPRHDSIVRIQLGRLRQKLMAYYQSEGIADPLVITIPKGAFKLEFGRALQTPPGAGPAEEPVEVPRPRTWVWIVIAASLFWAATATVLWVQSRRSMAPANARWTPELETLWAPFLNSNRPVLVCLGTPLFVRFPSYGIFRDPRVNTWQDTERSERFAGVKKSLGDHDLFANYSFTGAGEASAAFLISKLLSTRKTDMLLTRSNLISWQQVVDSDVVFIGPPKFNQQLQSAPLLQDIVVEADGIRNLKPRPGEPVFLEDRITPTEGQTHALISRTPGISGAGQLLVIGGNASPDTFAAGEWLTQGWRAGDLVKHLREPSGEIPRYFQAVIKVSFKQGIPVHSSYVFHHVLSTQPSSPSR